MQCTWPVDAAVAWSVCFVCWSEPWAVLKRLNHSRCRLSGVPKEPWIRWWPLYPRCRSNFGGHLLAQREVYRISRPSWSKVIQWVTAVMRPFAAITAVACYLSWHTRWGRKVSFIMQCNLTKFSTRSMAQATLDVCSIWRQLFWTSAVTMTFVVCVCWLCH